MEVETIGPVGLGLLGRGIATCLLGHGHQVIAFTRRQPTHTEARQYIARAIGDLVDRAGFAATLIDQWPRRYEAVESLDRFGRCDFVIESIVEDIAAKQKIFDEIERAVGPLSVNRGVPIASNTSAIPISHLQRRRKHPERFLGMHWAETIDRACRNALGLWATMCGPLRWMDLSGGPALYAKAVQDVLPTLSNTTELAPYARRSGGQRRPRHRQRARLLWVHRAGGRAVVSAVSRARLDRA